MGGYATWSEVGLWGFRHTTAIRVPIRGSNDHVELQNAPPIGWPRAVVRAPMIGKCGS